MAGLGFSEPFSSLGLAGLQDVDGFGELSGLPGAAAEFAQDVPGLALGVGALTGPGEPGMGAVGGFPATRRSPRAQVGTAAGARLVGGAGRSCGSSLVNPSEMRARRAAARSPALSDRSCADS